MQAQLQRAIGMGDRAAPIFDPEDEGEGKAPSVHTYRLMSTLAAERGQGQD